MLKKIIPILLLLGALSFLMAQITEPISAEKYAAYTVVETDDTTSPYYQDLGVRRVIVANADGSEDGSQEIIATDYANGGRAHVLKVVSDSLLEIIWSSPIAPSESGSTPRFVQVGDCDGDGLKEIIFEQRNFENVDGSFGRIVIYEWNGTDWGTQPSMSITPKSLAPTPEGAGGREGLRLHREVLIVYDFDGDGKTEIIPHGDNPRFDVLILGVDGDIYEGFNFASIVIEGGKPGTQSNGGDIGVGGSFWNATPADIDGDGKIEIINHTWDKYGFWSIDVLGPNSYYYPEVNDAEHPAYRQYSAEDAVSYFGAQAVDVNGDGRDELVGTMYNQAHDLSMLAFTEADTGVYIWDEASLTENYKVIVPNPIIAALADKPASSLWPIVKGDLNKDGKDELYTGGGAGLNLVAVQYKGEGDSPADLLNPENYDVNLVYDGEGGDVFAKWRIQNGRAEYRFDTLYAGTDTMKVTKTPIGFDDSVIDTIKLETPFTSYIFADDVDLDGDGKFEIVLAEQSVYDSIEINIYDWVDTSGIGQWIKNNETSYKIFNDYRKTIRVLEYTGTATGLEENLFGIITPDDYRLEQNFPNPFNPTTTINFTLPLDKSITLKVYDMLGKEIKTLLSDKSFKKGNHKTVWDGTNNFGNKVASGNYIAKLEFGSFAKSIKMTLLK